MENTLKYILILLIIVVFYYLINCNNNGFSIGGGITIHNLLFDNINLDDLNDDEYQCQEYVQGIASCCNKYENNCSDGFPYYCDTDCSESFDNFKNNCSNTRLGDTMIKSRGYYNDIKNRSCKNTCPNISLERDIDNICKDKELKDFFKNIDLKTLYDNVIESYCNNDGKKNGIFISMLIRGRDSIYIDNSGSFLRIDISWNLYTENYDGGFGLFWDPEDLNSQNNFLKCTYYSDGGTTYRFITSNLKDPSRCGKFIDLPNNMMPPPKDLVPVKCKDFDCISEMFDQMKVKNKCPCGDSCSYNEVVYNEVVYNNTDIDKYLKEFYKSNDNIKPSGLIFFTRNEYAFQQKNTIEIILNLYSSEIHMVKRTFPLDTKVIILLKFNGNTPPIFNGITTLGDFEEYLRSLDIKRSNDKCKNTVICD